MSGKSSTEELSDNLAEIVRLIERGNNLSGVGKYPDAELYWTTSESTPAIIGKSSPKNNLPTIDGTISNANPVVASM